MLGVVGDPHRRPRPPRRQQRGQLRVRLHASPRLRHEPDGGPVAAVLEPDGDDGAGHPPRRGQEAKGLTADHEAQDQQHQTEQEEQHDREHAVILPRHGRAGAPVSASGLPTLDGLADEVVEELDVVADVLQLLRAALGEDRRQPGTAPVAQLHRPPTPLRGDGEQAGPPVARIGAPGDHAPAHEPVHLTRHRGVVEPEPQGQPVARSPAPSPPPWRPAACSRRDPCPRRGRSSSPPPRCGARAGPARTRSHRSRPPSSPSPRSSGPKKMYDTGTP